MKIPKTTLTYEESLEREKGMIFPSEFSESTCVAVSHSLNCIKAIKKQIAKKKVKKGDDYICPICGEIAKTNYCGCCGQKLDCEEQEENKQ